jgi:hypothetical protein
MRKCANISPYMRRLLVIYNFASAPFSISLYMRRVFFLFYHFGKRRTLPTTGTFDVAKSRDVSKSRDSTTGTPATP